ncbi:hypothetical protein L486_07851 [Kwoniella mangroviensis CBS 10435]|uniref:Uncharacterized protein n=1 Tax=Kwoniella mangroviensis CBS 10435 TaxID=1331196 RepID=A0A1B9IH21_9TREE|nr:uncharacterized protein I203_07159 [Kwoniella mangroviensis CBS 8507]OCF54717.1 hypothetical protein L486_07851 [Kwoniella mangroviensis CBS 10435]OCF63838.1 hypothetical protein I203_07159 [Kwoniella mangroviensis CBS 8507]OCF78651.1 hypothetical protein I204_00593 [Kwoniella mangroviensis CBS 8886]
MSFRSATRLSTRLASASRATLTAQPAARRYASTTGPQKGGDTTWMIGSAVVFGSLGAFLLLPSKASSHAATHSQEHAKVRAEINESAPTVKQGEAVQATDSGKYSPKTPDPSGIHKSADKAPSEIPVKKDESKTMPENLIENDSLKPESKSGGKDANEVAKSQSSSEDKQDAPGTEEDEDNAAGKEQGEPTQKEIKDSILRAERTNTPKAAMSEEAKGHETQAE